MDYHVLKQELALPAYAAASDQEAADLLNAVNQSVARQSITGRRAVGAHDASANTPR